MNGDGVVDLAVGAYGDDDGQTPDHPSDTAPGAVWVLFMNADGTVNSHQKISATEGGLVGPIDFVDTFGSSVTSIGDLDSDGVDRPGCGRVPRHDPRGATWRCRSGCSC